MWYLKAEEYLGRARNYLNDDNCHQGWSALQSAHRTFLLDPSDPDRLRRAAISLFHELEKIGGRRAKAIKGLICDDETGALLKDIPPARVIDALAHRDDQFQTNYFKIILRRQHLLLLFRLLLAGIAVTLALSYFGLFQAPFSDFKLMTGVILFGTLGAALSVARGLLRADVSAKIPAQQLGSFVIWMRPAIGAAAALISFVLLRAKAIRLFEWDETSPVIIFTVAIVAGFSERFIVGAIERLASGSEEDKKKEKDSEVKGKTKAAAAGKSEQ
jgi:hypothetical protein